jgi:general secretion pathway protein E
MPDGPLPATAPTIETILARRGALSGAALDRARRLEAESGERIDRIAAKLGMVSDADLAAAYAELLGAPVLTAAEFPAAPLVLDGLQTSFLKTARSIPIAAHEAGLTVAMADPLDDAAVRALEFALDRPVLRRAALPTDIEAAYDRLYGDPAAAGAGFIELAERADEDRDADLERLKDLASEAPAARAVRCLSGRSAPGQLLSGSAHPRQITAWLCRRQSCKPASGHRTQSYKEYAAKFHREAANGAAREAL